MEVRKTNTPSAPYQGSGPEVPVKLDIPVKQEPIRDSASPKAEKKSAGATLIESIVTSEDEKQSFVDSNEVAKKNSMKKAVEELNRKSKNSELIFGIHDGTNRVTIKVVDRGTKEVIREYPD